MELRLSVEGQWDDDPRPEDRDRRTEGEFTIDSVTNARGDSVNVRDLEVRLQTLQLDEGYWLDTGTVTT